MTGQRSETLATLMAVYPLWHVSRADGSSPESGFTAHREGHPALWAATLADLELLLRRAEHPPGRGGF